MRLVGWKAISGWRCKREDRFWSPGQRRLPELTMCTQLLVVSAPGCNFRHSPGETLRLHQGLAAAVGTCIEIGLRRRACRNTPPRSPSPARQSGGNRAPAKILDLLRMAEGPAGILGLCFVWPASDPAVANPRRRFPAKLSVLVDRPRKAAIAHSQEAPVPIVLRNPDLKLDLRIRCRTQHSGDTAKRRQSVKGRLDAGAPPRRRKSRFWAIVTRCIGKLEVPDRIAVCGVKRVRLKSKNTPASLRLSEQFAS